jgi:hypothetical protein
MACSEGESRTLFATKGKLKGSIRLIANGEWNVLKLPSGVRDLDRVENRISHPSDAERLLSIVPKSSPLADIDQV